MLNDALLLQTALTSNPQTHHPDWAGQFWDMLRLCYPRHSAYCRAHLMDYYCIMGDVHPEQWPGGWNKIWLIIEALERGYPFVAYLDSDAVVWNMDCDIRNALPPDKFIGACFHNPENSEYLRQLSIPPHYNVGVLYFRNSPDTLAFCREWAGMFPGDPRWMEQGAFNELVTGKYSHLFTRVDDTWNATVNVNDTPAPNVRAWHGIWPPMKRMAFMKDALREDFIRFRV